MGDGAQKAWLGDGNLLQQIDTDIQQLTQAAYRIALALEALANPAFVVTGSRGGNTALASLLTGLAAAGTIVDNTTP